MLWPNPNSYTRMILWHRCTIRLINVTSIFLFKWRLLMLMRSVPTLRHISSLAHTMRLSAHFAYFWRKVLRCVDLVNLDGLLHTFFYSDAAGELNTDNNYCICPVPVRCTIDEKINMTWLEVRHSRPSRFDGHSPQKERKNARSKLKFWSFIFCNIWRNRRIYLHLYPAHHHLLGVLSTLLSHWLNSFQSTTAPIQSTLSQKYISI